jgi:DNA helicase HerA-like ATPase
MPADPFFIAQGSTDLYLLPQMANRHGLIAGATGTGKTISLRVLAENFSAIGVPVFLADVKGDLAGLAKPGVASPKIRERAEKLGLDITPNGFPVVFWDVFGKSGHPVRATISDMGPLLLARLLNLNETQEGVLNVVFQVADEEGLLLLDLKDLQAMLQYVAQNAAQFTTKYGNVSAASVGTIQRALLTLQREGGAQFFGEPALNLDDFLQTAEDGRGILNILAADQLMAAPRTYAAFMLWMLSELFERLPEVGDVDQPKLVFFFDEAHLLFSDLPDAMQDKVEQVVRLVRSKGVGVYFVSQNPLDIPDKVLGQLGNRIQHALRAFTPRDQKAVKAAAETFRANPKLDVEKVIGELGVGEALISMLDARGTPGIVERALVAPPVSQLEPLAPDERKILIEGSVLFGTYEQTVDRESAYERLQGTAPAATSTPKPTAASGNAGAAPYDAVAAARMRAAARQQNAGTSAAAAGGTIADAMSAPSGSRSFAEAMGNPVPPPPPIEEEPDPSRVERMRAEAANRPLSPREEEQRRKEEYHQARMEKMRLDLEMKQQKAADQPTFAGKMVQSAARGAANQAARSFMRGLLGSIFGGRR